MENNNKQFSVMQDEKFIEFLTDQFGDMRKEFNEKLGEEVGGLREEFSASLKNEIGGLKNTTATKSFLTDKLIDLKGDLIVKLRQEDSKVNLLIGILSDNKAIKGPDIEKLKEIEVFPAL